MQKQGRWAAPSSPPPPLAFLHLPPLGALPVPPEPSLSLPSVPPLAFLLS